MYEIVIKLSDEEYEALQRASYYSFDKYTAYIAMKSGIALPKGHGRMIDADKLEEKVEKHRNMLKISEYDKELVLHYTNIEMAPTTIEADEETDSDEY